MSDTIRDERDPASITPHFGKCIVKLKPQAKMSGLIHLVRRKNDEYGREGTIFSMCENPPEEVNHLKAGDRVWFSQHVDVDDSRFFRWGEDEFTLIPVEAMMVAEVAA